MTRRKERRGGEEKKKKNLRKPAIDIHLSPQDINFPRLYTVQVFLERGLTKLFAVTSQWKFYFNFVLMKITSLRVDGLSISPVIWRRREQVTRTTGQLNRCLLLSKGRNRSFNPSYKYVSTDTYLYQFIRLKGVIKSNSKRKKEGRNLKYDRVFDLPKFHGYLYISSRVFNSRLINSTSTNILYRSHVVSAILFSSLKNSLDSWKKINNEVYYE